MVSGVVLGMVDVAVERVQLFSRLKADCLAGRDADFGTGAGIPPDAGFPGPDAEDSEAAQLDSISSRQCLFETFKDQVDGRFSPGPRQACPLDYMVDNVLLDQCGGP